MDRTGFIGGSDVAAILGISKWKSAYQLYQEKIGELVETPDPARDRVLKRGKRLEPVVVEMLIDELKDRGHDVRVEDRNNHYNDDEHKYLACELDMELVIDGEEMNGEIKTVHPFAARDWGEPGSDEIPIYYAAQVMHGLMIKPRRRAIVAALVGADDLRIHFIDRDEETISAIRSKEIEFWQRVQDRNPPPPSSPEDIKRLYPKDDGEVIEANEEIISICQWIRDSKKEMKMLEEQIEAASAKVKAHMGTASTLYFMGSKIASWKSNKESKVTDWKAAYLDLGPSDEHIEKFTTIKPGARPLLIK